GVSAAGAEGDVEAVTGGIAAPLGAHDDGRPDPPVAVPRPGAAYLPTAIARPSHHRAHVGDDRAQDRGILDQVMPAEPLRRLVDMLQAVDAAIKHPRREVELARQLLGQWHRRLNETAPLAKPCPEWVLRLALGGLLHHP